MVLAKVISLFCEIDTGNRERAKDLFVLRDVLRSGRAVESDGRLRDGKPICVFH
jgi:hypothetical protein